MLRRFHDPQRGRIDLDGIDIRTLEPAELRGTVALVPQQPTIFASSARENIRYGRLEAGDADIQAADRSAEAHDFLSVLPAGYAIGRAHVCTPVTNAHLACLLLH